MGFFDRNRQELIEVSVAGPMSQSAVPERPPWLVATPKAASMSVMRS